MRLFSKSDAPGTKFTTSSKSTDKLIALAEVIESFQSNIDFNEYDGLAIKLDWVEISGCVCPTLVMDLTRQDSRKHTVIGLPQAETE